MMPPSPSDLTRLTVNKNFENVDICSVNALPIDSALLFGSADTTARPIGNPTLNRNGIPKLNIISQHRVMADVTSPDTTGGVISNAARTLGAFFVLVRPFNIATESPCIMTLLLMSLAVTGILVIAPALIISIILDGGIKPNRRCTSTAVLAPATS